MSADRKRRRTDGFLPHWLPERVYRDVWLFLITGVVLLAISQATTASNDALSAVHAVQQNRLELIGSNCDAGNARNANTIARLNSEIATLPPRERAQAKASESFTVGLIDALAPVQDCKAVVARARIGH